MINVATFATNIDTMVRRFPQELQAPMRDLTVWMVEEFQVSHKDFSELKDTVKRLVEAQKRLEEKIERLTGRRNSNVSGTRCRIKSPVGYAGGNL